jgi:hypothetical protein
MEAIRLVRGWDGERATRDREHPALVDPFVERFQVGDLNGVADLHCAGGM